MKKTPDKNLSSFEMEIAVVNLLDYRRHEIVPNVSWGIVNHECDLLCLDGNGRFTEIEIKISRSDLKADFSKTHNHSSKMISRLVYAVPSEILDTAIELCPKHCGIIEVTTTDGKYDTKVFEAHWYRMCRHNGNRPTEIQINQFRRLGLMRIWTLKQHLKYQIKRKTKTLTPS